MYEWFKKRNGTPDLKSLEFVRPLVVGSASLFGQQTFSMVFGVSIGIFEVRAHVLTHQTPPSVTSAGTVKEFFSTTMDVLIVRISWNK